MEKSKLLKLLNLTASDNDHEALSAIRLANALIKREKTTWEKVFAPSVVQQTRVVYDEPKEVSVKEMFEVVMKNFDHPFINSLYEYWNTRGRLTPRQRDALAKFYRNCA